MIRTGLAPASHGPIAARPRRGPGLTKTAGRKILRHSTLIDSFQKLGLNPQRCAGIGEQWEVMIPPAARVYWWRSPGSDETVQLPRVCAAGKDTHARSFSEILFLLGMKG